MGGEARGRARERYIGAREEGERKGESKEESRKGERVKDQEEAKCLDYIVKDL